MALYRVQLDQITVYEVEVEADSRDAALAAAESIVNVQGKQQYLKDEYALEANFAELLSQPVGSK
jgi:hypothetical protein